MITYFKKRVKVFTKLLTYCNQHVKVFLHVQLAAVT